MQKRLQHKAAIFFTILFLGIIAAPSIIISIDDSVDITILYGQNEEEEKETFKILFEISSSDFEDGFMDFLENKQDGYAFKSYPKPHLNLISPPPESVL